MANGDVRLYRGGAGGRVTNALIDVQRLRDMEAQAQQEQDAQNALGGAVEGYTPETGYSPGTMADVARHSPGSMPGLMEYDEAQKTNAFNQAAIPVLEATFAGQPPPEGSVEALMNMDPAKYLTLKKEIISMGTAQKAEELKDLKNDGRILQYIAKTLQDAGPDDYGPKLMELKAINADLKDGVDFDFDTLINEGYQNKTKHLGELAMGIDMYQAAVGTSENELAGTVGDFANTQLKLHQMDPVAYPIDQVTKDIKDFTAANIEGKAKGEAPVFNLNQAGDKKFEETVAARAVQDISEGYKKVKEVPSLVSSIDTAFDLIERSYTGTFADKKKNVLKFFESMGMPLDEKSKQMMQDTDLLESTLKERVSKGIQTTLTGQVSDKDIELIEDAYGTIGRNPEALKALLLFAREKAVDMVDTHNKFIDNLGEDRASKLEQYRVKSDFTRTVGGMPDASKYPPGSIATNKKTGRKMVSTGSSWVPVKVNKGGK